MSLLAVLNKLFKQDIFFFLAITTNLLYFSNLFNFISVPN